MHLWFEHVLLLSLAFDFASGGMLPCLMPVYLYMFDRWYPTWFGMFGVLLAQTLLTGGLQTCFGRFDFRKCFRWSTAMFWRACFGMFISARWYTDMFWHACSSTCLCFAFANTCDWCYTEGRAGHNKSAQNSRKQVWRACTLWNACFTR